MRLLTTATIVMLALLPLRWFTVLATPAGTLYLHELGLLLLSVVALATVRWRVFAKALDSTLAFSALMAAGFMVWGASCLAFHVSLASDVKQVAYLAAFLVVVGIFTLFAGSPDQSGMRALRWAGVVTTITLLLALEVALTLNHINAVSVFGHAVASGDPSVIETELFRPAFVGFGYSDAEAVSQLRHEVFAGLLVSLLVASWAQHRIPFGRRSAVVVSQSALVLGALLIVLSLSRSVQLAAVSWALIAGLRVVLRGPLTRRQLMSGAVIVVVLVGVTASGFVGVVVQRVTQDSTSYDQRGAKLGAALDVIGHYPWVGGRYDDVISSHNFVIDAWLRGGVVMAVLMMMVLLLVLRQLVDNLFVLAWAPTWFVAATAAFVLPLVRMFTIGAGLLTPPEWVSLGFAMAASAGYARELAAMRRARATKHAPTAGRQLTT